MFEDSRAQTILDFIPSYTNSDVKIADIVFVHDDSGSMDDEAAQVKANVTDFANQLSSSNIDFRLALVPYGGNGGFSPPEGRILHNGVLHSETAPFIANIEQMRFNGGTEKAFQAMQLAVQNLNWRPTTQKVLILVTDEPNNIGGPTESELITELQNNNVTVYALTAGHAEFNRIADATGGRVFNITDDFSNILSDIGQAIASRYFIQYKTDNPAFDGQTRTVKLTATEGNTLTGIYTPPMIEITLTQETQTLIDNGQMPRVPLTITAKVIHQNPTAMINATLFYRNEQQQNQDFIAVPMTHQSNNICIADIPAQDIVGHFVSFYISVTESSMTKTLPDTFSLTNVTIY